MHLDGLAEAHVVGQAAAQAQLAHPHQPAQPDQLVGAEHPVEPVGGSCSLAHRLVAHLGCQPLELGVGLLVHLHREPAHLGGAGRVAPSAVSAGMLEPCRASCASWRARRSAVEPSTFHSPPIRTSGSVAAASARNSSGEMGVPPSAADRS